MDLLKTVMLYMALSFAGGVQGAEMPEVTPEPTPEPTPVVTVVPATEVPTASPTPYITPVPTPVPTPTPTPAPTPSITANPSYHNLKLKSRGDDVKRLQQRLIELGWLTDTADGAFGRQTMTAVIRFQKANGLDPDGIAGRMTQTVLFEYEGVVYGPGVAAPTPTPTPVPLSLLDYSVYPIEEGKLILDIDGDAEEVPVRLFYCDDDECAYVALEDLYTAVSGWTYSVDQDAYTLEAPGYKTEITRKGNDFAAKVNGDHIALEPSELQLIGNDLVCRMTFLDFALQAEREWNPETQTLTLTMHQQDAVQ